MGQENVALVAFNRGRVSRLALARTDVKRVSFSAEVMTNYMAKVLGGMGLRVGTEYLGAHAGAPRMLPFIFATDDTAALEFTNAALRVWVDDALVTRLAVSTAVTNGSFTTDLSGWTDNDEAGGTSVWVTGGYMGLTGNGTAYAIRDQTLSVAAADQAVEHGIRITIQRGPVMLRIGTTTGADDLVSETELGTGTHSLAVTPNAASICIRLFSPLKRQVLVDSVEIEAAGVMSLPSPFVTADLGKIRFHQSADVVYLACYGYQQRKIERRATNSWSLVRYQANDGPLRTANFGPITLTPSALSGNITVTASKNFFKSTHGPSTNNDGAIFRITSNGQQVSASITAQNQFTNAIRVEGVDAQRVFTYAASALTATGTTITLQRSLESDSGPWTDVLNLVADTTIAYDDGLDNQIAWYRFGCKVGNYAAGTIAISLSYTVGSIDGYVRVTSYTSAVLVDAEVMVDLGGISATDDWAEGEWSDRRGWPSAVRLYDGRLNWSGKGGFWGSVSDGFESFDEAVEGDSGPINRDVGAGPVDNINWMLDLTRLICGADGAEYSVKTTALDEPITPTNFQVKPDSTQGSANVEAWKIDKKGYFVQNGGTRIFELDRGESVDYSAADMTVLVPEICDPGVVRSAVQRKPDTRLHYVLDDGTVAVAIIDRAENVLCWLKLEVREGDEVVDVMVLPGDFGTGEDAVYYSVARDLNGSTVYTYERCTLESECLGGDLNKQADCMAWYSGPAISSMTAAHLANEEVVLWMDGDCPEDSDGEIVTFTADGTGTVTWTGTYPAAENVVMGLSYVAQWKSTKLAYAALGGTALNQLKTFDHLGVILDRSHFRGLKYGPDFNHLSFMPEVEDGLALADGTQHDQYDKKPFEFDGEWNEDSRLCLQSEAPRNCTILAATLPIEEHSTK